MSHGWTEHKRFLEAEWELLSALPVATIPKFKWLNLNYIKNVHLSKFLPPLIPLEAEVGGGSPCWCPFSVLHVQVAEETRKTNSFGVQWKRCLRNASCSICPWIPPPKLSLKYQHSYLSHTPWPSAAFCFFRKVPGYCSAENGSSPGIPGKLGVSPKPPVPQDREGGSPTSHRTGRGQKDWCSPGEAIIICCTGFVAFPRAFIWAVFRVGKFMSPQASAAKRSFIFQAAHKSVFVRIIKSWSGWELSWYLLWIIFLSISVCF